LCCFMSDFLEELGYLILNTSFFLKKIFFSAAGTRRRQI
jgi:hypothetical protein